jgi:AraC family transcriptional regulator, transcriptional activator of pobA
MASSLPLFHLYGDPPDDQTFDFIHIETIASRAPSQDWSIRAHRHRNLFQILLIEQGGGEMTFDMAHLPFTAPAAILVPAATAHGFRFEPSMTDGWVISFTEDVAEPLTGRAGDALARLRALAAEPVVAISDEAENARLSALCREPFEEGSLARGGYRLAMRGLLVLIAVSVARLAASRERTASAQPIDTTVAQLRALIDENFRAQHQLGFYAAKLSMTVDRLNDRVKQSTGVTVGHLIRQRLITEAKRQLVFTSQPIHDISKELAFTDPSHFARFFRKQTGIAPHEFRDQRGG